MATHPNQTPLVTVVQNDLPSQLVARSRSTDSFSREHKKVQDVDTEAFLDETQEEQPVTFYSRFRPYILAATAFVILGWWVSATVLKATRHRW